MGSNLTVYPVTDKKFAKYGRIIKDYDTTELFKAMEKTPLPEDVIYVPSDSDLEALPIMKQFQEGLYGGLPVQIGYCNGNNHKLNAVEYHRSSEINGAVTDLILLIGMQQDITEDFQYDTSKIEAFLVPAGTLVEVYATTLHYAPCNANDGGFRCVVVLPRDTNLELEVQPKDAKEDALITARNKWLIAHADAKIEGAFVGLVGENLSI
jgi:hypothetical protein